MTDLVAEVMDAASGLRSTNFAIGESAPSGWMNSILMFGSVANTVMTPCSGSGYRAGNLGAERRAVDARGLSASFTAIAT